MRHALIGLGFIGGATARMLQDGGEFVRGMDSRPQSETDCNELVIGDVRDPRDLELAITEQDVVHLYAGEMGFSWDYSRYWQNPLNVARIFEVLEKIEPQWRPRRLVLASSQAVYSGGFGACESPRGYGNGGGFSTMLDCHPPASPYGLSKLQSEEVAQALAERLGVELYVLRYGIVVGPGQRWQSPYTGVVRSFAASVIHGVPPLIFEDGEQSRDYIYINDVANANYMAASGSIPPGTYNVSGIVRATVNEVWEFIKEKSGVSLDPVRPGLARAGDVRHMTSDCTKLREQGWEPRIYWKDAVKEYLGWATLSESVPIPPDPMFALAELTLKGEVVEWEPESLPSTQAE